MAEFTLRLSGMSCGACEKLIGRVADGQGVGLKEIDAKSGFATFICDQEKLPVLKQALALKGFNEQRGDEFMQERGNWESVKKYCASIMNNEPALGVERTLLNYAAISLALLLILAGSAYVFSLLPLGTAYLPLVLLAILGSVLTAFSYYHMDCYRKGLTCTNGMMIGMTMGMVSGFMFGSLIGATNGMFIGSLAGMAVGIGLGINLGRSCGVMGAMEGAMAGLMAGPMGAMTSVMLINDNLIAFLYIFFPLCAFVISGLSYMMYREAGAAPSHAFRANLLKIFNLSLLLFLATVFLMLFGPKGLITYP